MELSQNVLEKFRVHLEFLGYKTTKDEYGAFVQSEQNFPRKILITDKPSGFIFTCTYIARQQAKMKPLGYFEWVNQINKTAVMIAAFISDNGDLTFAALFPKMYDKELFGGLFQTFCHDIEKSLFGQGNRTGEFLE